MTTVIPATAPARWPAVAGLVPGYFPLVIVTGIVSITRRCWLGPFEVVTLTPRYWIGMGAVAITTLVGSSLALARDRPPLLAELAALLEGFTLFL